MQVMKMSQAFEMLGHKTELLVPKIAGEIPAIEDLWHHYGISKPFRITRICRTDGWRRYLFILLSVVRSRQKGPDLILCRIIKIACILSLLNIPSLVEFHDLPRGRLIRIYLRLLKKGKGFRGAIAITNSLKDDILYHYKGFLRQENITVCPDGVDLQLFKEKDSDDAKQRLKLPISSFVAGYAGHLYPGKGLEIILPLAKKCPDVTFLVVGGKMEAVKRNLELVRRESLTNILFFGFVANSELPLYLYACDALLLPNQRSVRTSSGKGNIGRYTSPLKLFEYLAAGRPIIASDLPVLREALDESCAIFCEPDSITSWSRALILLKEDIELRIRMGEHCSKHAGDFSWESRCRKILKFSRR